MNVTLTVQKMVTGGHCLAVLDGKNILIPYTIPGETVEAEIIKENRDYSFARLIRVIEPSPHRVEPVCPHYGIC
ncbi:MAG: TRAM domain-containing protein, partial [Treponema sp.]|nr:TRAM domain-containing protein [Treponema sp.]